MWALSKRETINTFVAWRQTVTYNLSLEPLFIQFFDTNVTWKKKSRANQTRGFKDDTSDVPEADRLTAAQKVTHLELLLGQIAMYAPVIARSTIICRCTSIPSVWQALRQYYGFHVTESYVPDQSQAMLESYEFPETLFQQSATLMDTF